MTESTGDLLIGGDRIKHVHIDLQNEQPTGNTNEWNLAGQMHLTTEQSYLVETDRPYRLRLDDGRCGQVIVRRIAANSNPNELLAEFLPKGGIDKSA